MTAPAETDDREIRVFLSSTFRDMDDERNHLLQHVFPRFRQECAARNVGFTEIDLRWGITEESSQNGLTVEICLSEIDRCRRYPPFFIGFLGERYGWAPTAADLDAYWREHSNPQYASAIRAALVRGISVTELEIRFGVLDHLQAPEGIKAHFFLRDSGLTRELSRGAAAADFYDDGGGRLAALKQALRDTGKVDMDGYTSVQAFGERVYQRLSEGLNARYPAEQVPTELQQRAQAHARFAASRRQAYVPLPRMRAAVRDTLVASEGAELRHIYLSGPSGIGKSALMADLAEWLPRQWEGTWVYARYSGADGSRELSQWRDDLLARLLPAGEPQALASLAGDAERWQALSQALAVAVAVAVGGSGSGSGSEHGSATGPAPVLLLIDAVDQLDKPGDALRLLSLQFWPAHVTLLVSGLPDCQPSHGFIVLPLEATDAPLRAGIIAAFTSGYRKALAPALVEQLCAAPATGSPLFLRMVLEELRVRSHHETLAADIASLLAQQQPDALFAHLLRRWDEVYSDAAHPGIVSALAALLAVSHAGLSENELADLLAARHDLASPETGKPRLPSARLSPLLAVLRPFLLRHDGREGLMHQALLRGALPPAPGPVRHALIRHFGAWHWRHVTERLFQRLQLAGGAAPGSAPHAALEKELTELATLFFLPRKERGLARDGLALMDAASAAPDTRAALIGQGWGRQLRQAGERSLAQKARDFFHRDDPAMQPMATRLNWVNDIVGDLTTWACYTVAAPLAEQTVALLESRGNEPGRLAAAYNNLANLNMARGRLELAAAQFARLQAYLRTHPSAVPDELTTNLLNQSNLYRQRGLNREALPLAREAVELTRKAMPYNARAAAIALQLLGMIQSSLGDLAQSVRTMEEAQAAAQRAGSDTDSDLLGLQIGLAQAYRQMSRFDDAAALYRSVLANCHAGLLQGHPTTAACAIRLGSLYQALGRFSEAEPLMREALAIHRVAYGGAHMDIANDLIFLGHLLHSQGRYEEAESHLQEALSMVRTADAGNRQSEMRVLTLLSRCKCGQEDFAQAERHGLEALNIAQADLNPQHPETATVLADLGAVYAAAGLFERAEQLLTEALAMRRASLPAGHNDICATLGELGELYIKMQRPDLAEPLLVEAVQIAQALSSQRIASTGVLMLNLAGVYLMQHRPEEAHALLLQSVEWLRGSDPGSGQEALANALAALCLAAAQLQRWDESQASGREALARMRAMGPGVAAERFNCLQFLLLAPQPPQAALLLLEEALPIGRTLLPGVTVPLASMLQTAADHLMELGHTAAAGAFREEAVALWRAAARSGDGGASASLAGALYWLAKHWLGTGETLHAVASLEEALALLRAQDFADERVLMMVLFTLSREYRRSPEASAAAAALEHEADAIAARLEAPDGGETRTRAPVNPTAPA